MDSDENARRKKEWLEQLEREGKLTRNPTEDHKFGLKVLQNTLRREILVSLGSERISFEGIKEKFNLDDHMANFHLNMLEDALYIEKKGRRRKDILYSNPSRRRLSGKCGIEKK